MNEGVMNSLSDADKARVKFAQQFYTEKAKETFDKIPLLEDGYNKWLENEIKYLGNQKVYINTEVQSEKDGRLRIVTNNYRLSDTDWQQIKDAQQAYIDERTETFFQKLKDRFDAEPKEYQSATKDTVLWVLSKAMPEPIAIVDWLPFIPQDEALFSIPQPGEIIIDITTIRKCYSERNNLGIKWVESNNVFYKELTPQTAMLGYVRFLEYLEKPAPPAETAPVGENKPKTKRKTDPYNAKIKAKFFDMVIEKDATIMGKKTYQNNNEKFKDYAKTMLESFGLVVKPGTLENNWNKTLNEPEKKYLRELLITHNYRDLALTVAVTM